MQRLPEHTWREAVVHILRPNSRVLRGRVGHCMVTTEGSVAMEVVFVEHGKVKKKLVSPIALASMQLLWLNNDVVSEEDEPNTKAIEPLVETLPPLSCLNAALMPVNTQEALRWTFAQTNLLLGLRFPDEK